MRDHRTTAIPLDAETVQGQPAGLVSRLLVALVDAVVVTGLAVGVYGATAALLFAWNPRTFVFPDWPAGVVLVVAGSLEVDYLTIAWWVAGRSYGCVLLGLRVVDTAGETLPLARAFLRAVLCTIFPIGLAWCALDPRGRAVHDLVVRSRVIYDWRQRNI